MEDVCCWPVRPMSAMRLSPSALCFCQHYRCVWTGIKARLGNSDGFFWTLFDKIWPVPVATVIMLDKLRMERSKTELSSCSFLSVHWLNGTKRRHKSLLLHRAMDREGKSLQKLRQHFSGYGELFQQTPRGLSYFETICLLTVFQMAESYKAWLLPRLGPGTALWEGGVNLCLLL